MGNYRPLCDVWILARPKFKKKGTKFYGSFPGGFHHRARQLLGVGWEDPVLHVCGGLVREGLYADKGFGPNDCAVDLNPDTEPEFLLDVRKIGIDKGMIFPLLDRKTDEVWTVEIGKDVQFVEDEFLWPAMLIDRPYTEEDHTHYDVPADVFPADLNALLKNCLRCVRPKGRVGVLDYLWPHPGKVGTEVAVVAVGTGRNNRARWFTVFERLD